MEEIVFEEEEAEAEEEDEEEEEEEEKEETGFLLSVILIYVDADNVS